MPCLPFQQHLKIMMGSLLLILSLLLVPDNVQAAEKVRVACIGDSITVGVGAGKGKSWPNQLQGLLGDSAEVKTFAVSGTTLSTQGDNPYVKKAEWKNALAFNPHLVVIKLGTNDTKPQNITKAATFAPDLTAMVEALTALPSKPKIWLCLPCFVPAPGNFGINEDSLLAEVIPAIQKVAAEKKLPLIDIHAATEGHPEVFPDRVHPNDAGAAIIAKTVQAALMTK